MEKLYLTFIELRSKVNTCNGEYPTKVCWSIIMRPITYFIIVNHHDHESWTIVLQLYQTLSTSCSTNKLGTTQRNTQHTTITLQYLCIPFPCGRIRWARNPAAQAQNTVNDFIGMNTRDHKSITWSSQSYFFSPFQGLCQNSTHLTLFFVHI